VIDGPGHDKSRFLYIAPLPADTINRVVAPIGQIPPHEPPIGLPRRFAVAQEARAGNSALHESQAGNVG
jgi:hypothetical protein